MASAVLTVIVLIIDDKLKKSRRKKLFAHIEWATKIRDEMLHLANDLEASQKDGIEDFLTNCEKEGFKAKTDQMTHELDLSIGKSSAGNIISEAEGCEFLARVKEVRRDWQRLVESKHPQLEQQKYQERLREVNSRRRENESKDKVAAIMQAGKSLRDCAAAGKELEESLARR